MTEVRLVETQVVHSSCSGTIYLDRFQWSMYFGLLQHYPNDRPGDVDRVMDMRRMTREEHGLHLHSLIEPC